jgi:branched-chain amino acid transport system permease protein
MVSFGHAAFVGIGAYCVAISQVHGISNGWLHLAFAIVACGVAGLVIGYLALRTSGIYFIMITLAFAQMLFFLFVSLEAYGGDDGMSIDRAEFGIIDLYEPLRLYFLIWACLAIVAMLLMFIVRSRFGVTLRAVKSNASRVEAMGLSPLRFKITGYVISAVICGIAGGLFASWQEYVSPDIMHWTRSGELMIIIILGGTGYTCRAAFRGDCFSASGRVLAGAAWQSGASLCRKLDDIVWPAINHGGAVRSWRVERHDRALVCGAQCRW